MLRPATSAAVAAADRRHGPVRRPLGADPAGPFLLAARSCGPGRHRRPHVDEQRLVRRLRRGGPQPAYRDDKRGTTLQMLPDLLSGHQGAWLTAQAGGTTIECPQALLVSNGPYEMSDIAGLGRRGRLEADAPQIPSPSMARPSCCPHPSGAPSSRGRFGWSCPGNGPAFPLPSRPWNGCGCGSLPPSAPSQRPCPSPPSQTGSRARKHSR